MVLKLAFLFFIGSVSGWVIELFYRHYVSDTNPEHKWINPGFCTGPYLPIYGFGLCILYLISLLEQFQWIQNPLINKGLLFLLMAVCMTLIEYIAGMFTLKIAKVRLWDYTNELGNIQGVICPKYSIIWAILGAVYYFLIHPHIIGALEWFANNLAFSFVIGLFFGVFIIDVVKSAELVAKLKQYAEENNLVVRYEMIKADIHDGYVQAKKKYHFFLPFRSEFPLSEHLKHLKEQSETKSSKHRRQ